MSLLSCLSPPDEAAIALSMRYDSGKVARIVRKRRQWPLASLLWWAEWHGIILTHGQGR